MSFIIYTKPNCTFCVRAKEVLGRMGFAYQEIKVGDDISREDLLALFPGSTHLPIILRDGQMIGGFDKLEDHLKENENHG